MLGLIGNTPQIHHFHYDISWLNDIFSWYTPPTFFWTPQKNGCSIHIFAGKINEVCGRVVSTFWLVDSSVPVVCWVNPIFRLVNMVNLWSTTKTIFCLSGWWHTYSSEKSWSWDDGHPIYEMESHKIPWFQTTNQFWLFSIYSKKLEDWTTHPVGWGWFNHHLVR